MSKSPFLRIPLLPMIDILDMMHFPEILRLSLCSEKTRNVLKAAKREISLDSLSQGQVRNMNILEMIDLLLLETQTNSQEFFWKYQRSININLDREFTLCITVENMPTFMIFYIYVDSMEMQNVYYGIKGTLKMGNIMIPFVNTSHRSMHIFSHSKAEGFKLIADYFKMMLKPEIKEIKIVGEKLYGFSKIWRKLLTKKWTKSEKNDYSENIKSIVNWVSSNQKSVETCEIYYGQFIKDEDYQLILGNTHFKNKSCRYGKRKNGFVYHGTISANRFQIDCDAKWFSIDNLLDTNCSHITVFGTRLKNDDMKKYLDAWMTGRFPKLESLIVEMKEDVDVLIVLSGLFKYEHSHTWKSENHVHIKRHDGIIAKIIYLGCDVNKSFKMFVES